MHEHHFVAIMAGGVGSRFWPGSREERPKQFLDILGVGKSLIRLTYERFAKIIPAENIFVVTNEMYKELVKEHIPELTYNQILCEPSRNNTAPSVAYTAFKLRAIDPEASFVMAPSDHVILQEDHFLEKITQAFAFADQTDALVTLGMQPSRPDTGYGYIHYEKEGTDGIHKVKQFTEKPDITRAKDFVDSGEYLWNAGIFIWHTQRIIEAFERHVPEIYTLFNDIATDFNTYAEDAVIKREYPKSPNISIDYAILEPSKNVYTIPSEFGWSDLGTWNSLHIESDKKDADGNTVLASQAILKDTKNCLVRSYEDKLVVVGGLEDFIIVDEKDVLLIYPKSKEQEVKAIRQQVAEKVDKKYV